MTQKTDKQQAHSLISLYELLYTNRFKRKPQINRWRDQWGFLSMLEDLGYERAREVLEQFFNIKRPDKSLSALFNNYDRIDESMRLKAEDEKERARLRRETAKKVEEWRQQKQK